ncbi:MAG: extracellular solute-binding protein [Planctomycetota bacterium]
MRWTLAIIVAGLALASGLLLLSGCGGSEGEESLQLVVYCGREESLVHEQLVEFEKETGIDVQVLYGKGTSELANQLLLERDLSPCDLFVAQDGGHLGLLAERGLLSELPESILSTVDPRFRDPDRRWIGTSGRARVLVHDPARTPAERLPRRLEDLAAPGFDLRLGWAPANGSFQAHVSAMLAKWGEERTRTWLAAVAAKKPLRFPSNSAQVKAVASGELDVGWVNHYYVHKLRTQDPDLAAANWSFPEAGDLGNLLMVSGVGVTAPEGPRRDAARKLAAFLVSERAQRFFAERLFEYPTRPGVATAPGVPPLEELGLADVNPKDMIAIGRVTDLLGRLNIR